MTVETPIPVNVEQEEAVVGAVLISEAVLPPISVDEGLRPEHFYSAKLGEVYGAMLRVADRGEGVDVATVWAELQRSRADREERISRAELDALTASVPSASNARGYARRVRELAVLRAKQRAAYEILQAVAAEDQDALATAEGGLAVETVEQRTWTPDRLAADLFDYLNRGGDRAWPLPWAALTERQAGGLRPGQVTVVAGHSSHGKSVVVDQILETVARHPSGPSVHLYINEMTPRERGLRFVARDAGLNFTRLMLGDRDGIDGQAFLRSIQRIPFGITDVAGWTAEEIARDMRRRRYDVVGIDIFNLIENGRGETRDLDRISRVINAAAKQAGCHVLLVAHLNESRALGHRPEPTLSDIRGTGQLKNDADNVLFVWREQTDDGTEVLEDGRLYFAKARNGLLGGVRVVFQGKRMRFLESDSPKEGA